MLIGTRAATGDAIATLDGDGQNNPADIPRLLKTLRGLRQENPKTMVAGHRKRRQDTGCGLKVFPRALLLELPYFGHMHRFLPALAQRAADRIVSVEVNHRPRTTPGNGFGWGLSICSG